MTDPCNHSREHILVRSKYPPLSLPFACAKLDMHMQPHVARKLMPWLAPFLFLCTENWRSEESLKKIPANIHMLLLSGLRDELVPPEQMQILWKVVTREGMGQSKRMWEEFPRGTHSAFF